ncbi:MAG: chromosomal replication initiator protein DnaA [Defluviitaleaceae bacterium]|nr:chromosomal replication initiator protein DnaA [Defluviitaleaceae bacterium]
MDAQTLQEIWEQALPLIEKTVSQVAFDVTIRSISPYSYDNGIFTLRTSDDFFKPTINKRYLSDITRCVRIVSQIEDIDVRIVSPEDFDDSNLVRRENYERTNLRRRYAFDTFVKGKCNELAYAAAEAVAENPGKTDYNPLFLYGGVGLGKTHLMHSIGNYVVDQYPEVKVLYVTSETFTSEFIAAIREDRKDEFKDKYRECDILLMDDVQFLEGKVETQEEMFHTFNTLYNNNKQIVLTSDQPPKDLTALEARLTSRFAMGLTADITIPDYETRTAILEKKLHLEHLDIDQTVKDFITRNVVSNIRDLEGALNKITAYARLTNAQISLSLAEQALKDQLVSNQKPDVTVPYIQQVVAKHYNITTADLSGRRRTQNIVLPRQIAMYLSRKLLEVSLPEVGNYFGGRDHSTVIHSCEKITNEIEIDSKLRDTVNDLERNIKGD